MAKKKRKAYPREKNLLPLDYIASSFENPLIDTSAVLGHISLKGTSSPKTANFANLNCVYSSMLKGNYFLTVKGVIEELLDERHHRYCMFRGNRGNREWERSCEFANFIRLNGLIFDGHEDGKINSGVLESTLASSYYHLLGDVDISLFRAYCFSALAGESTALITNDFPLLKTLQIFMRNNDIDAGRNALFIRRKQNGRCERVEIN